MNDSIYRISLDVHEHGSQTVLKAKHTDTGRTLCISLRHGGTPYPVTLDVYAVFKATKSDGTIIYNACTIEGGEIIYEFTEQTCAAIGRSSCEIALYDMDGNHITSPRFTLLVDGTIYPDDVVESTDEFSALTDLIAKTLSSNDAATEATSKANAATDNANTATQNANEATQTANQAASAATQAAQSANTATNNANGAATSANEATLAANNAASGANLAAENANETVSNVSKIVKNTMIVGKVAGESVYMNDAVEFGFTGFRIFGKTTQNGTPTPDAPVELVSVCNSGSVGVFVTGKNLLDLSKLADKSTTGVTITNNKNGSITFVSDGTYTGYYNSAIVLSLPTGRYKLVEPALTPGVFIRLSAKGTTEYTQYTSGMVFEYDNRLHDLRFFIQSEPGMVVNKTFWPMICLASEKDYTFELYKAQTLTLSTPNGLPGIPVTSGGNYIDANGQQWICDEIDFKRGVSIQRIYVGVFDGSSDESIALNTGTSGMASRFVLPTPNIKSGYVLCNYAAQSAWGSSEGKIGTGIEGSVTQIAYIGWSSNTAITVAEFKAILAKKPLIVIAPLATPIETPLSEEEFAAYASLNTYRDNTTVSNDASTYMEIEYVMDAKKYIDSLLASSGIIQATVE